MGSPPRRRGSSAQGRGSPALHPQGRPRSAPLPHRRIHPGWRTGTLRCRDRVRRPLPRVSGNHRRHPRRRTLRIPARPASGRNRTLMIPPHRDSRMYRGSRERCTALPVRVPARIPLQAPVPLPRPLQARAQAQVPAQAPVRVQEQVRARPRARALPRIPLRKSRRHRSPASPPGRKCPPRTRPGTRTRRFPCMPSPLPRWRMRSRPPRSLSRRPRRTWSAPLRAPP